MDDKKNTNPVSAEEAENEVKSDMKENGLKKLKAGDLVEVEGCLEGGFVKEFDGEQVFLKFSAFHILLSGLLKLEGSVSEEEHAGVSIMYRDLLLELQLLTFGKKTW